MTNNNSESFSINQPERPTPTLTSTEARSCSRCIYSNPDPDLLCAVNPVAAMTYYSLQSHDCIDFQCKPQSEEEVFNVDYESRFEERRRSNEAELQAAGEDAVRSVQVELLQAINRINVDGIFAAVNKIDEVLEATRQQHFHTVLGAENDSDGPPVSPSMLLQLRRPPTLALAQAMVDQQYHELSTYVRRSAADFEQIEQWRTRADALSEYVDKLKQRQEDIRESHRTWSPLRIKVALFIAVLVFGFFLLLAGSTNIVGYSLGFFAGGLTLFLVRG